jgi:hypothetical protein
LREGGGGLGEGVSETPPRPAAGRSGLPGIEFPVLCFNQDIILVHHTYDEVTTASKAGLKGGWYDGLLIVSANSVAIRVKGATKLYGDGRFWGYNVFLNQRIHVGLEFDEPSFEISLGAVKSEVHRSLTKEYDLWSSGESVPRLRSQVNQAQSVVEIIRLFEQPPEAEAWAAEQRSFKRKLRSLLTYVVILGVVFLLILLQEKFA